MNERVTQKDLEKLKDYDRLRLEYTRLHEDYRRLLNIPVFSNRRELEKPTMEKYGWQSSNSFDEESGWMFEGGEDAYFEALKKWEAVH